MINMLTKLNSSQTVIQFIRYGIIGMLSNAFCFTLFLLLTHFNINPKTAMTMLYLSAVMVSYGCNRRWTFAHHGAVANTLSRFLFTHVLGYFINLVMLLIWVDKYHYPYQFIQALAIIVVAIFVFIVSKFFVFANSDYIGSLH